MSTFSEIHTAVLGVEYETGWTSQPAGFNQGTLLFSIDDGDYVWNTVGNGGAKSVVQRNQVGEQPDIPESDIEVLGGYIKQRLWMQKSSGTVPLVVFQAILYIEDIEYLSGGFSIVTSGAWELVEILWGTNPHAGRAWRASDFQIGGRDAIQGMGIYQPSSVGGMGSNRCTAIDFQVQWDPTLAPKTAKRESFSNLNPEGAGTSKNPVARTRVIDAD